MPKVLDIIKHPNPLLKLVCERVYEFDDYVRSLAADMLYTIGPRYNGTASDLFGNKSMAQIERTGVGLAAPQTGNCIRLVVIAAPGYPEMAMVNPVIERHKGWELGSEGCLSLPGETGGVYRYTDIWITYQDLNGKPRRMKARDYQARVIQHEIDHLDGIEFTDRIEEQQEVYA